MYFYKIIKVLSQSKFLQKLQREKMRNKKRKLVVDIYIYLTLNFFNKKNNLRIEIRWPMFNKI